jgi:hypothetical protein
MKARKDQEIWNRAPRKSVRHKPLSAAKKKAAKAAAKRAGRPYPNLVDNIRAATKKSARKKRD